MRRTAKSCVTLLAAAVLIVAAGSAWLTPTCGVCVGRHWRIASIARGLLVYQQVDPVQFSASIPTRAFIRLTDANESMQFRGWMWRPNIWRIAVPGFLQLTFPMWPLLLALAIPASVLWVRDRNPKPGRCAHCGYDLTGNQSGRCSECGATLPD